MRVGSTSWGSAGSEGSSGNFQTMRSCSGRWIAPPARPAATSSAHGCRWLGRGSPARTATRRAHRWSGRSTSPSPGTAATTAGGCGGCARRGGGTVRRLGANPKRSACAVITSLIRSASAMSGTNTLLLRSGRGTAMVPSAAVSEHARYRRQLGRLGADEFADTVVRVAAERGWVEPGTAGRRVFGRFEPGASPWATLLYRFGRIHVRVDAFDDGSPLRFTRVEDDGVLAGLGAVLRAHPDADIIRYRPGRRCVLRIGERYVKLVPPELGARLHEAGSPALEGSRRRSTCRSGSRSPIAGTATRARCGRASSRAGRSCRRCGQAAAAPSPVSSALRSGRSPPRRSSPGSSGPREQQWARTERAATQVLRRVPELGDELSDLLARLRDLHERFAPRPPVPVHGAASPDQWLDDGSTLGLVDFDRFSWSDPELDVAAFLGPLDFERLASRLARRPRDRAARRTPPGRLRPGCPPLRRVPGGRRVCARWPAPQWPCDRTATNVPRAICRRSRRCCGRVSKSVDGVEVEVDGPLPDLAPVGGPNFDRLAEVEADEDA